MSLSTLSTEDREFLERMAKGPRPVAISGDMQERLMRLGYVRWFHNRLELTAKATSELDDAAPAWEPSRP